MQGICVLFCSKLLCCFLGSYGGWFLVRFCIFRMVVDGGFIGTDEWDRMEYDMVFLFCFVMHGDQWQLRNRRIGRRFCCRDWAL
jgi:hypothetical protein